MIAQVKAYIGLGSNIGEGRRTLKHGWEAIGEHEAIQLTTLSSPYVSAPVGMESNNWFINGVGSLVTTLDPEELLDHLLNTEERFGRRRSAHAQGYEDRTLDLDLLFYGDFVLDDRRLVVPHPHFSNRLFVLAPIAEIAPDWTDPVDGMTMLEKKHNLDSRMESGEISNQEITLSTWE